MCTHPTFAIPRPPLSIERIRLYLYGNRWASHGSNKKRERDRDREDKKTGGGRGGSARDGGRHGLLDAMPSSSMETVDTGSKKRSVQPLQKINREPLIISMYLRGS
ncbi:hypothetical protein PTI98_012070 [Pleurotus ostreatus]|nr:hypothetical protein PTI98_012070 [Pleurotus ostreatus]